MSCCEYGYFSWFVYVNEFVWFYDVECFFDMGCGSVFFVKQDMLKFFYLFVICVCQYIKQCGCDKYDGDVF